MVDLAEAGERLRHLTLDEPTPVVELRRRRGARTRKRRRIGLGAAGGIFVVAALFAALTLSTSGRPAERVVTGLGSTTPTDSLAGPTSAATGGHRAAPYSASPNISALAPTTGLAGAAPAQPATTHPADADAVDYGLLQLWLPPGWHIFSTSATATGSCPPAQSVMFDTTVPASCTQPATVASEAYVMVTTLAEATPAINPTHQWINGIPVSESSGPSSAPGFSITTYRITRLGVSIQATATGEVVVDSLGPSSFYALSHETALPEVPASWKTVRYDGFEARVPNIWPVQTLTAEDTPPGECSDLTFPAPQVYLGDAGAATNCPYESSTGVPATSNGLWMRPYLANLPGSGDYNTTLPRTPVTETLADADVHEYFTGTAVVGVTSGSHRVSVVVGLGANPTVAEEVLASIRLVSDKATSAGELGHMAGRMLLAGGPATANPRPVAGTVVVTGGGLKPTTVTVGARGTFNFSERPGTYQVIGQEAGVDGIDCPVSGAVTVSAGKTTHVLAACEANVP
jgi:hypothetical protein